MWPRNELDDQAAIFDTLNGEVARLDSQPLPDAPIDGDPESRPNFRPTRGSKSGG